MPRTADHLHEYMHGNGTDILLGSIWQLPPKTGSVHLYPSILPLVSKCILGRESFYPASGVKILHFYTSDCLFGIVITILFCGFLTGTAKSLMTNSSEPKKYPAVQYCINLFDACLMYLAEHLHLKRSQFPGYSSQVMSDKWLHLFWLLGSFLLYSIASQDLINLLISPLESTRYTSIHDVALRDDPDLTVYYFPHSSLDHMIQTGQIKLRNAFRVPRGRYLMDNKDRIFGEEMIREKSIVVAGWDNLELFQTGSIEGFHTYKQLDVDEDSFAYIFTSTTMDPQAERHFRKVYMHGFVESGTLVRDVSWYRWSHMLALNMKHATDSEDDEAERHGQHFEPLKLDALREFFMFCAACHVMWFFIFGPIYAVQRHHQHRKMKFNKIHKVRSWKMRARSKHGQRSRTMPNIRSDQVIRVVYK